MRRMKIIGTAEAARRLNVTQSRVRVLIDSGRLKAMKVGREWLIDPKDLDAVKERKVGRPRKARKTFKTINKNLRGEAAKANKSTDKR